MSTQVSSATFDLARFCAAAEGRDVETQLSMYAPDAAVTITDRINQPGAPQLLHGREEIAGWLQDICGRDMSHHVQHSVGDASGAAFSEACRYPDGTNVLCATVLRLSDGQIAEQTVVQAWDES
ncbi:MAG TPA: nuclear transport factor 2 family protein [Solirubrobacteraceae bacterium]|jgi:ketosteroid isomerase-like protein